MSTELITVKDAIKDNAREENENTANFFITTKCVECDDVVSFPSDSLDYGYDDAENWIVGTDEVTSNLGDDCSECGCDKFTITEISYCGKYVYLGDMS